jgi:hypothetical protein
MSDNVGSMDFQNLSLTEILLNDISFDHKLFPDAFTTFRFYRVSSTKSSNAVVRAVSRKMEPLKVDIICSLMTNDLGGHFHPKWPQFTYW